MIDLHVHSAASDGTLSPPDLVAYAADHGVTALALTDHDTLAGISEASDAAKTRGITVIPGVELTGTCTTGTLHILGLGVRDSASLEALIQEQQRERRKRNDKIIAVMQEAGLRVTLGAVEELAHTQSVGRPHFADWLVREGVVKNRSMAFNRYLGRGQSWYFEHPGVPPRDAIKAILAAGACPVLAHPLSLYLSWSHLPVAIRELMDFGLQGLEAWHPGAKEGECQRLEEMARGLGLCTTAGSDFHEPPSKPTRKRRKSSHTQCEIGHTAGGTEITEELISVSLGKLTGL
jgi:predicted metal-dependent phosphoesterase TrpH